MKREPNLEPPPPAPEFEWEILAYALGILVAFFAAIILVLGILHPILVNLDNANAIQITQVYAEASHTMQTAIGLFAFSIVCILIRIASKD